MAKPLTAASVEKFRCTDKRQEIADGGCAGLYLVIQAKTGAKSWVLRYRRPDGRSAKLLLGPAWTVDEGSALSLAGARRKAATLRHEIAQGRDPGARRPGSMGEDVDAFPRAAQAFLAHAKRTTRSWRVRAAMLGLDAEGGIVKGGLADKWRDRPVADITEDELFRVIDEARERGVPGTAPTVGRSEGRARVFHTALSVFFSWLKERRLIKVNPMIGLKRPATSRPGQRVLTDDEIRKFWRACEVIGGPRGDVLKLLLLTGQRLQEIARMRWSELGDDGVLQIPGSRTKNKRDHALPLPLMALQIVQVHIAAREPSAPVFTLDGKKPIAGFHRVKRRLDNLMGPAHPWVIHDLRRTAVTGMARAGVSLPVIERCVNHVSGSFGGIVSVYQRHSFVDEMAAGLRTWEKLLIEIVS